MVLGIGTDIGKTYFMEGLLGKVSFSRGIKPVISGFKVGDLGSDSSKILLAQGGMVTDENISGVSPWRFEEAVSPHFAAQSQGSEIDFDELVLYCNSEIEKSRLKGQNLFIEGAGGVMSPINFEKNFLDLAIALKIPVLLVGANYLGSISHILTATKVLTDSNVVVENIIINENTPFYKKEENDIIKTVENFTKIRTLLLEDFLNQLN